MSFNRLALAILNKNFVAKIKKAVLSFPVFSCILTDYRYESFFVGDRFFILFHF